MKMRTMIVTVSALMLVSALCASVASAQYFEEAQPGYLPAKGTQKIPNLSRATAPDEPPLTRFGFALDFGAGGLQYGAQDRDFFEPNGAPALNTTVALAWDLTIYAQMVDSVRIGLNVGQLTGGKTNREAKLLHAGLDIEGGHRFYNGFGIWLGANFGYGKGQLVSRSPADNTYYFDATGLGLRAMLRLEYEVAPFVTLRLTPFVDTLVRTNEAYSEYAWENAPAMQYPTDTKGTFLGYGAMFGIAIHSF